MKKQTFWLGIFILGIFVTSCGEGEEKEDKELVVTYEDEDSELYEFEAFNLAPYEIDAIVYLPDATANIGAATAPKVEHELDDYKWDLYLGQNFHMHIEDWGDEDALNDYISNLKDHDHIYQIDYIEKSDNFIYYKSTLKVDGEVPSENIGTEHISYHCVGQHTIKGINYLFRTGKSGAPKPITEYMAKSIKSVEQITDPA